MSRIGFLATPEPNDEAAPSNVALQLHAYASESVSGTFLVGLRKEASR
jgi:hypothetical protein